MRGMTERPPFEDITSPDACTHAFPDKRFDTVEPKYDGMWVEGQVRSGRLTLRSRRGTVKKTCHVGSVPDCTVIGELLVGTQWSTKSIQYPVAGSEQDPLRGLSTSRSGTLVLFDVLEIAGQPCAALPYRERRAALLKLLSGHTWPSWLVCGESFPIEQWRALWAERVENGDWEGVVFKDSSAAYGTPWARLKREVTCEYVFMGVTPGRGRCAGMAGAIRGGLYADGELVEILRVSGLDDRTRRALAADPQRFVGRVFEAKGNALFKSGALRHPRIVLDDNGDIKFRDDKRARECVAA